MKTLFTEIQIRERVFELAHLIAKGCKSKKIHIIVVLKGAFIFSADLARELAKKNIEVTIDCISAKSYVGTKSSGKVEIIGKVDVTSKEVLIVEDIIDTGRTLKALKAHLMKDKPLSIKVACLLDKPSRRVVSFKPDFTGFTIEDRFVVGYGLDCDEKHRALPFIAVID